MATNHPRLVLIAQAVQAGAKGGREGGACQMAEACYADLKGPLPGLV